MDAPGLLTICISAFVAVFFLLSVLAVVMRLIQVAFPAREGGGDLAVLAAVTSAVAALYPNSRITKIEELE
jgi:hypothetical protein